METRERILRAAYECFSSKGFMGTTTREIARRAGVSEVTLFRHFRSKRELFEEVLNKFSVLPDLERIPPGGAKEVALEILKSLKEKKCFIKILLSEVSLYPKEVREIYERFLDRLDLLIANFLRCEREVARAFHSALFGYFLSEEIFMGRELSGKEIEGFVERLVKLFGAGDLDERGD